MSEHQHSPLLIPLSTVMKHSSPRDSRVIVPPLQMKSAHGMHDVCLLTKAQCKKQKGQKDYDTWCSQVVSNPCTVNIPLSDNGFWILLQFAVRGGAMFHIGILEKSGCE